MLAKGPANTTSSSLGNALSQILKDRSPLPDELNTSPFLLPLKRIHRVVILAKQPFDPAPVSYTHLTLPTIYSV